MQCFPIGRLSVMDAAGKPSPDLRMLNLNWVGSYQECLAIDSTNSSNNVTRFSGKYCTAVMVVQNVCLSLYLADSYIYVFRL